MNKRYLVFLALLAFLTGCVPVDSLNPLYSDKDVVFDKTLAGEWVTVKEEEETTLAFVTLIDNGKESGYMLTMSSRNKDGKCSNMEFEGHLVSIGGRKFLDLVPEQWEVNSHVYPLRIGHSKSGATIAPQILRLGMSSYLEFTAGAQPQASLRPAHWFFRVWTDGKKLRLDWADDDKFKKSVEQGKFHLSNALLGEAKNKDVVITASTQELQKFVAEHAEDEKLFSEHIDEMEKKP